ncbi:MAG: hypothetical protein IPH18_01270 [Chitinophagaceae bacterium]|nr:hypothetical protein [Chitinophagaceae bacterium]
MSQPAQTRLSVTTDKLLREVLITDVRVVIQVLCRNSINREKKKVDFTIT